MKKQNDNYDTYEKMTNIFLLCREIAQVTAIYKKFIEKIPDRNAKEITVVFDRLFFDYIIINCLFIGCQGLFHLFCLLCISCITR